MNFKMDNKSGNKNCDISSIAELMGSGLKISQETNIFNSHFFLYKNHRHSFDQQKRREHFLKKQKEYRQNVHNKMRNIADGEDVDEQCLVSQKDKTIGPIKKSNLHRNQLMLSEWMLEKPSDFKENWIMVICPIGKRCLVISSHGQTKAYGRNGSIFKSFPSYLPGGNKKDLYQHRGNSILDCIYLETEKCFYILDLLSWNDACFQDSSADLRFYWLSSRISEEYSKLNTIDRLNPYKFNFLERHLCDNKSIESSLLHFSDTSKIDGVLFFHKLSLYTPGLTPLVCWLKLDMLKEILNVNIDLKTAKNKMEIED